MTPTLAPRADALRFGFACVPLGLPQPVVHSCKLANATPAGRAS